MNKLPIIKGICLFLSWCCLNSLTGQTSGCGTMVTSEQIALEKTINLSPFKPNESLPILSRKLSVAIYIVNDQTGNSGITAQKIQTAIDNLNTAFSPIQLSFSICNTNYISNYQFNTINSLSNEGDLLVQYYTKNDINIYLASKLIDKYGSEVCGYALMPSDQKNAIFINKDCISGNELIHQMGHFFNLYHTHETILGKELVNGSNCSQAGDKCCDTPADPGLNGSVSGSCDYAGTARDPKNDFYIPTTHNYMSFSNDACRCRFSNDQFIRMIDALNNLKKDLW